MDEIAEMEGFSALIGKDPHFVVRKWMWTHKEIGKT